MANIFPSDIEASDIERFKFDERDTLQTLRDDLSEDYSIYHSVHWSKANRQNTAFGEIDFVIVNKSGHLLVIEQKNGPLNETPQGLEKTYGLSKKLVYSQIQRNLGALRSKFGKSNPQSPPLNVDYLIYCPDHRVVDVNAAGADMLRIVDAQSRSSLAVRVTELLGMDADENSILSNELHNFFLNSFRIAPDVNAYKSNQRKVYRHLLDGLSDVIENLEFSPFRLRIIGTAGSGKTQVTIKFCEQAVAEGRRPLLLCFNRLLADKLATLAPENVTTNTYHGFCKDTAESLGIAIDFSKADEPGFWRDIQEQLVDADLSGIQKFDCLVVDEGQDFKPEWYDILQLFLEDDATQLWLEDPLQKLRETEPVLLPDFVTYRESANFRTPTKIASFIKATLESQFEQRNTLPGLGVSMYEYANTVELSRILDSRVRELVKVGFTPEDIVIVSCRGMKSTALAGVEKIYKHKVRRFTGNYDADSEQIYTDGDLRFETIFRFKGQQAPVVILVDLDDTLKRDDWATGILYCAMTRATVRLELVVQKKCPWIEVFRENVDED